MNQLLKLITANRGVGQFRAESGENEDTLYLYDVIVSDDGWGGGVSPVMFAPAINKLKAPTVHLRINSPGGDVFAARAMEQIIKEHPSRIVAHVDGIAASAASYVALAADEVLINPGGMFMIHKAWAMTVGNSDDLLHFAGVLEKVDEALVETYAASTGQKPDQIRDWLTAETWFDAAEAVEFGFADAIAEAAENSASNSGARTWDLSAYLHAPSQEEAAPAIPAAYEPDTAAIAKQHTDHLMRGLRLIEQAA